MDPLRELGFELDIVSNKGGGGGGGELEEGSRGGLGQT